MWFSAYRLSPVCRLLAVCGAAAFPALAQWLFREMQLGSLKAAWPPEELFRSLLPWPIWRTGHHTTCILQQG